LHTRLIAHYQVSCKKLKEEPWIPITDYLVDTNNTVIRVCLLLLHLSALKIVKYLFIRLVDINFYPE